MDYHVLLKGFFWLNSCENNGNEFNYYEREIHKQQKVQGQSEACAA